MSSPIIAKTASEWTAEDPILPELTIGLETDTGLTKTGDGVTSWIGLSYSTAESVIDARMFQRRDTAATWSTDNPVLTGGEIGFETDTGLFKIGDGVTAWDDLPYATDWDFVQNKPPVPRGFVVFVAGRTSDNETVFRDKVTADNAFTIAASSTVCNAVAGTAATGSTTFTLKKNGSSVGTFTFAASGTEATVTISSPVTFAAGDTREIVGPATSDATLANISITIGGEA